MAQNPVSLSARTAVWIRRISSTNWSAQELGGTMPRHPATAATPPASRLKISHEAAPEPRQRRPRQRPPFPSIARNTANVRRRKNAPSAEKPICPQCMELFGYFCSPLCKNKAEAAGHRRARLMPGKSPVEARFWRKTGLIFGRMSAAVVLFFGLWIWYAWFGSVPHPYFSVRFADDDRAYSGGSQLVGEDQIVFLHGGTLARYDLKTKKPVWSQELVTQGADCRHRQSRKIRSGCPRE